MPIDGIGSNRSNQSDPRFQLQKDNGNPPSSNIGDATTSTTTTQKELGKFEVINTRPPQAGANNKTADTVPKRTLTELGVQVAGANQANYFGSAGWVSDRASETVVMANRDVLNTRRSLAKKVAMNSANIGLQLTGALVTLLCNRFKVPLIPGSGLGMLTNNVTTYVGNRINADTRIHNLPLDKKPFEEKHSSIGKFTQRVNDSVKKKINKHIKHTSDAATKPLDGQHLAQIDNSAIAMMATDDFQDFLKDEFTKAQEALHGPSLSTHAYDGFWPLAQPIDGENILEQAGNFLTLAKADLQVFVAPMTIIGLAKSIHTLACHSGEVSGKELSNLAGAIKHVRATLDEFSYQNSIPSTNAEHELANSLYLKDGEIGKLIGTLDKLEVAILGKSRKDLLDLSPGSPDLGFATHDEIADAITYTPGVQKALLSQRMPGVTVDKATQMPIFDLGLMANHVKEHGFTYSNPYLQRQHIQALCERYEMFATTKNLEAIQNACGRYGMPLPDGIPEKKERQGQFVTPFPQNSDLGREVDKDNYEFVMRMTSGKGVDDRAGDTF